MHLVELDTGGASSFDPHGYGGEPGGPELLIHNPDLEVPSEEPVDDRHVLTKLIALSHEAGHVTSWNTNADDAWNLYYAAIGHRFAIRKRVTRAHRDATPAVREHAIVQAVLTDLTQERREAIWSEENRAWDFAEKLLRDHRFDDWEPFNQRRDKALRSYEVTLGRIPFDLSALGPLD